MINLLRKVIKDVAANTSVVLGLPVLDSGTYTPVASNVVNVDATTIPAVFNYLRVGDIVTVSGYMEIDTTSTVGGFSLDLTLPIASNVQNVNGAVAGSGKSFYIPDPAFYITSSASGNRVTVAGDTNNTGNLGVTMQFTYRII